MKTLKYQSLMTLAVLGLSIQANYGADSLSPLNGASSDLASSFTAPAAMEANVVPLTSPVYVNPNPNFDAVVASTGGFNDPVGAAPLSIPEPTTLALIGFGGLIALTFVRRFGKANRA